MITPSFLDMYRWLGKAPNSSIAEQVDVMDALQVTIAQSTGMHMHSMVGFDPRRSAEDRNVLKVVKHAINDCGFVGVKLYPPMGFQPTENRKLEVPKEPKGPKGESIERALMELYDWCASEDVPIFAHAENSLGSVCGYGHRASPAWWRKVLANPKYARLRINLAHFGAFDEALDIGDNAPEGLRCEKDKYSGAVWEDIIGETIRDDGHDFLFADLGYLSELTIPDFQEEERPEIRRHLEQFRIAYDPDVRHLMYGTDWTMIAKEPTTTTISQISTVSFVSPASRRVAGEAWRGPAGPSQAHCFGASSRALGRERGRSRDRNLFGGRLSVKCRRNERLLG